MNYPPLLRTLARSGVEGNGAASAGKVYSALLVALFSGEVVAELSACPFVVTPSFRAEFLLSSPGKWQG